MKYLINYRRSGKTTELIKMAYRNGGYIVVHNHLEAYRVQTYAKEKLNFYIPLPFTYEEFINKKFYGMHIKNFYIDNVDMLVQYMAGVVPVKAISATTKEN